MITLRNHIRAPLLVLAFAACNVSQAPAVKPVALDSGVVGDDASTDGAAARTCPSALVVVSTDYMSTNISAVSPQGIALSESVISSGSMPPGLSQALSGDVVLPLAQTPGRIVLIDQIPNGVLTWVDPSTTKVLHQLDVRTGFGANPQDYLEVSSTKAYVTRYETNMNAGQQANDGGGDILIVDPEAVAITGRVPLAMPGDGDFLPRPARMLRVGAEVWVSLERYDADLKTAGDARLVGISSADDSIAWSVDLKGVASCGGIDRSPSGGVVALSCSGITGDSDPIGRSAIVLVDATAHPPVEMKRFSAADLFGAPLGFTVAYATEGLLVGVALGDLQAPRNDIAFTLDLTSGKAQSLVDGGAPFVLGDVRCSPGCTDLCFLADANANVLRFWKASGASLVSQASVPVDPTIGLPPRYLGTL